MKFVKSPYRLSVVSTPPFIKPGLPYIVQVSLLAVSMCSISRDWSDVRTFWSQVVVKDHLDHPVKNVVVGVVRQQLFSQGRGQGELTCPTSSTSSSTGVAFFICNVPVEAERVELTVRRRSF